jgi:hypothetical protein
MIFGSFYLNKNAHSFILDKDRVCARDNHSDKCTPIGNSTKYNDRWKVMVREEVTNGHVQNHCNQDKKNTVTDERSFHG